MSQKGLRFVLSFTLQVIEAAYLFLAELANLDPVAINTLLQWDLLYARRCLGKMISEPAGGRQRKHQQ